MLFRNRKLAGKMLANALREYKKKKNTMVIGLPRGGVVVADVVARELGLPLDLVVPRKIGAPGNPEFAIGAITEKGEPILNQEVVSAYGISKDYIEKTAAEEKMEAKRRLEVYRKDRPPLTLKNKEIILIDDGIATGLTMLAAIKSCKDKGAKKIIVATPCGAKDSINQISKKVDRVVCLHTPTFFGAVGAFYEEFAQTEDEEVIEIMKRQKENV